MLALVDFFYCFSLRFIQNDISSDHVEPIPKNKSDRDNTNHSLS